MAKGWLRYNNLDRAQFGATRRRVVPDFFFRRPHDVPGKNSRSPVSRHRLKTLLHLPVFERHEGEKHRPPARLDQLRDGGEQRVQLLASWFTAIRSAMKVCVAG